MGTGQHGATAYLTSALSQAPNLYLTRTVSSGYRDNTLTTPSVGPGPAPSDDPYLETVETEEAVESQVALSYIKLSL